MQTVDYRHFALSPGDRVLDLGCGEGRHTLSAYLEPGVQVIGIDLSLEDLMTTRSRFSEFEEAASSDSSFSLASANALALPFPDGCFDKVICSEVLEHIPDYRGALLEIQRVLRPGGLFCASVPRHWPERVCWSFSSEYHKVPGGHLRIFNGDALRAQIEEIGMCHYHRHWAHALHAPFWWLKCIFWERRDDHPLIRLYHRFLVWDLIDRPRLTRMLEAILNPLMGKSLVMYFRKEAS